MDTLSIVILLIVAFLGYSQGIIWLFVGALILIIITARSVGVAFLIIAALGALYLLNLGEYWYILLILLAVILILTKGMKEGAGGEGGAYSPELMQLLQGAGGGGYQ